MDIECSFCGQPHPPGEPGGPACVDAMAARQRYTRTEQRPACPGCGGPTELAGQKCSSCGG